MGADLTLEVREIHSSNAVFEQAKVSRACGDRGSAAKR
jgi:hypothetical protein